MDLWRLEATTTGSLNVRNKRTPLRPRRFASEALEPRRLLAAGPLITELMAINDGTLRDEDGDSSDWLEIYNSAEQPVDLTGWYLTDQFENLTRWKMPSLVLAPGQFHLIYASSKDRTDPAANLHTNFRLSGDGEFVALVQPDGTTIEHQYAPEFPQQLADVSFGLTTDLTSRVFFATPTPGAANGDGFVAVASAPQASVGRGIFEAPFQLELTTDSPEAEIHYTLDGSRPTSDRGRVYDGPIAIDSTTMLRAMTIRPNYRESEVVTHSYLFLQDVMQQSPAPDGFPAQWVLSDGETRSAVYGVNRTVVRTHEDTLRDDLRSVPTMSLVTSVEEVFGPGCDNPADRPCGAYNSGGSNIDSPTSVELIYPDGREGFQIDAGLRLQGGSSRLPSVRKRSLRLRFTAEFGPTSLEFPLFDSTAADRFDTIILRANVQDGWGNGPAGQRQLIKDEFARRTQLDMGQPSAHGTWTHLYINGLYWGLYNLVERPNAAFAAEHMGGEKEDWDALNGGRLREGNLDAWNEMLALTPRGGPDVRNFDDEKVRTNYEAIQEYLDVPNFIDYLLVGMYMGTEDWLPNNYYAARRSRDGDQPVDPHDPSGKFRFFHWDQEKALLGVDKFRNLPGFISPPGRIFQFLRFERRVS